MAAVNSLIDRIDAEFALANQREEQLRVQHVQEFQGRQQRLEKFENTLDQLREIWRPRLETLAHKFGPRVDVQPCIERGRRSAVFEFKSDLAYIKLRFAVAPDQEVQNAVFSYNLEILPILMKFDSHQVIEFPLDAIDHTALAKWFDDRIVGFVRTYLSLQENEYYLKDHMVEDPIARVRFPKYAAGATLEQKGKTIYFIDESTLNEFQERQHGHEQNKT